MSLDLAGSTGWTAGVPFTRPISGTFKIDGDTRGAKYIFLRNKLLSLIAIYDPKVCFIEEAMKPHIGVDRGTTIDTQMRLNGYIAIAEFVCELMGVRAIMCDRQDVLQHFTGRKRYKEKDGAKKACVARCHALKYLIDGYDSADAAAQWDFGCARLYPGAYATVRTNLPALLKGYDDANFPGNRGFTRRRRPKRIGNRTLFSNDPD